MIQEEDIEKALDHLKLGKTPGRDGILPEFITCGVNEMIKSLQAYFKRYGKVIPKDWEYNIIVPIHKKDSTTECGNYRPICLFQVAQKLYTTILESRLYALIEPKSEEDQAGFRPGRQIHDHIFALRTIVEKAWDRNQINYIAFLDLKATFDSVPQFENWRTLRAKRIPADHLEAIKSMAESPNNFLWKEV